MWDIGPVPLQGETGLLRLELSRWLGLSAPPGARGEELASSTPRGTGRTRPQGARSDGLVAVGTEAVPAAVHPPHFRTQNFRWTAPVGGGHLVVRPIGSQTHRPVAANHESAGAGTPRERSCPSSTPVTSTQVAQASTVSSRLRATPGLVSAPSQTGFAAGRRWTLTLGPALACQQRAERFELNRSLRGDRWV